MGDHDCHHAGDGAGVLLALPHAFLAGVLKAEQGITLPASPAAGGPGGYAVAQLFMPRDDTLRAQVTAIFTRIAAQVGSGQIDQIDQTPPLPRPDRHACLVC